MRIVVACLVALGALTACGTETSEPGTSGSWTEQLVKGRPGADSPVGIGAEGDEVLVVVLGEDGTVRSQLSRGGGDFEPGAPLQSDAGGYPGFADPVRLDGTWWLVGTGGQVGKGDDERLAFQPRVLRSDDGLTWQPVEVSGIPAPVDINDVVAAGDALVAVGDKRNEVDTGGASFEAAAWRSQDGATWVEVPLPGVVSQPSYEDESVAVSATAAEGRLLTGGRLGGRAVLWTSTDSGRTWSRTDSPEVAELSTVYALASQGSTVLVSGSVRGDEAGRFLRSDDGGSTFVPAADQPSQDSEGGYARLWAGGGRFFTFTEPSFEAFSDPAVCYADLDQCRDGAASDVGYVHASEDGDSWSVVDTTGLGVGDELAGIVGTDDGRMTMVHVVKAGLALHTWPAGAALPEGEPLSEPERVDLVSVPEGEDPEPGVRYHAPLFVHCGMDWLYLGDTPWQRTDGGPDVETGAGDEGPGSWPLAGQTIYGYATLGDDGVVQYSIGDSADAEVIATYERTGAQPPGCD